MRPGEHPTQALDVALLPVLPPTVAAELTGQEPLLVQLGRLADGPHVLVVVDQAEELFTVCTDDARTGRVRRRPGRRRRRPGRPDRGGADRARGLLRPVRRRPAAGHRDRGQPGAGRADDRRGVPPRDHPPRPTPRRHRRAGAGRRPGRRGHRATRRAAAAVHRAAGAVGGPHRPDHDARRPTGPPAGCTPRSPGSPSRSTPPWTPTSSKPPAGCSCGSPAPAPATPWPNAGSG